MGTSTGKNPFSKENAGGNQNDVTRTTLAPSNPPKPYAKGGSEMLQKLLMISEKTRRNLARQDAEAVEEQNVVKAEGNEKQEKQGKKRLVAVPLLGKPPKPSQARQEEQARPATTTTPDDVIDLVDSDDGAGDDCHAPTYTEANAGTQCPRSKSQTGVALFDIFDDGDDGDDGNVYFDDDEYYDDGDEGDDREDGEEGEDDDDDHRPQDPCPSLQEDLYGLPQEIGGQAWWRKLGDFQPISSIVQVGSLFAIGTLHVALPPSDCLTRAAPFARSPGRKPRRPRGSCPRGLPRAVQGHADIVISSRWGEEVFEIQARTLGDARRWVFGLDDPGCGRATLARPDSLSLTLFSHVFDVLVQKPERL